MFFSLCELEKKLNTFWYRQKNPKRNSNKKNFIFFKLKIETRIHFLQKNARGKKEGFTFLEYMKVQKIRIQSFCKLKILRHSQIQRVKTAKCFRKRQSHYFFTNANGTKVLFNKVFFQKMDVGPEGPRKRKALAPIFWENILLKRTFVCRLRL